MTTASQLKPLKINNGFYQYRGILISRGRDRLWRASGRVNGKPIICYASSLKKAVAYIERIAQQSD
jgi:hypothetical protein